MRSQWIWFAALAAALVSRSAAVADRPAFRVDVEYPTKDKPQSKLWFAHGTWWAWLPVKGGSSVWRRGNGVWRREAQLDAPLSGLPGQADVWADADSVHAVLLDARGLAVAELRWRGSGYRAETAPVRIEAGDAMETATIARDGRGRWWIAYNGKRSMWVRWSQDGCAWSSAMAVNAEPASDDDICAVVALPRRVGVMWSDQAHDAVYFRTHADGDDPGKWGAVEVVDQGGGTADDHIHTAVTSKGTLFVAMKNSVDTVGRPQQVLRVRDAQGRWSNHPYAMRTAKEQPSRPIVLLGGRAESLLLLHTLYRMDHPTPAQSTIAWMKTAPARVDVAAEARVLLDAGTRLNDVTGAKASLPDGQPWIVLASDQDGNVYEARLN